MDLDEIRRQGEARKRVDEAMEFSTTTTHEEVMDTLAKSKIASADGHQGPSVELILAEMNVHLRNISVFLRELSRTGITVSKDNYWD